MRSYSKKLHDLVESMNCQGIMSVELSLSHPDSAECVAAQMGGEDAMRNRYPMLYQAYQKGRQCPTNLLQEPKPTGFCNMATILDVAYDKIEGCAYAIGNMTLTDPAKRMCMTLDIYVEDKLIAHNMEIISNCLAGDIETVSQSMAPLEKGKEYKAYFQATWEPLSVHGLRSMVAKAEGSGTGEDVIATVEVIDPRHKVSAETDNITVSYARQATNLIDYSYEETRSPTGNEMVMLEVTGRAFFKEGYHLSAVEMNQTGAGLICCTMGNIMNMATMTYGTSKEDSNFFPVVEGDKNGIGWALNKEWENEIAQSVKAENRIYDFDFSVHFRCVEDTSLHHLLITSKNSQLLQHKDHCKLISAIRLYWGCLAGDTMICMEDGREMAISQLKEGDRILDGESGSAQSISAIIKGTEAVLYVLCTMDGKEIHASLGHPFLTNEGYKAVRDLHCGLSVQLKDGSFSPIQCCYPEVQNSSISVYNLELDGVHRSFVANGLVSGTNLLQGELLEQAHKLEQSLLPNPEIEAECQKMRADLLACCMEAYHE